MSNKTVSLEEQIAAEQAALRAEQESSAQRSKRLFALSTPIMERCVDILKSKPLEEAIPLLREQAVYLSGNPQVAVQNAINHGDAALQVLNHEIQMAKAQATA